MLALAYLVKRHTVNVKNRVRFPESTNRMMNKKFFKIMRLGVTATCSSPFLSERQVADDCFQFESESRTTTGL